MKPKLPLLGALVTQAEQHGGSLTKCANPECSVLVFGSGFCVACEKLPVPSAGSTQERK